MKLRRGYLYIVCLHCISIKNSLENVKPKGLSGSFVCLLFNWSVRADTRMGPEGTKLKQKLEPGLNPIPKQTLRNIYHREANVILYTNFITVSYLCMYSIITLLQYRAITLQQIIYYKHKNYDIPYRYFPRYTMSHYDH